MKISTWGKAEIRIETIVIIKEMKTRIKDEMSRAIWS